MARKNARQRLRAREAAVNECLEQVTELSSLQHADTLDALTPEEQSTLNELQKIVHVMRRKLKKRGVEITVQHWRSFYERFPQISGQLKERYGIDVYTLAEISHMDLNNGPVGPDDAFVLEMVRCEIMALMRT